MSDATNSVDLVLEGGGVRAIGLVGALEVLENHGYRVRRVAGTSGGAIVGALAAARMPASTMAQLFQGLDYGAFADNDTLSGIPFVGPVLALLARNGIHPGRVLEQWMTDRLQTYDVRTFADLPMEGGDPTEPREQFRLVVITSDVSRGLLVRLPWDSEQYGEEPRQLSVARAVRASMSIPFFFRPVTFKGRNGGGSTLVDGGLLSNFPVDVFDRKGAPPRWPTFGIKLSARPDANQVPQPVRGPLRLLGAVIQTGLNAHDQMHLNDPHVLARTMFVDTLGVLPFDFHVPRAKLEQIYTNGRTAAEKFLEGWDWDTYVRTYRSG